MKFKHPNHNKKWPHCIHISFDGASIPIVNGVANGMTLERIAILKHFGFKEVRHGVKGSKSRDREEV